MEIFLMAQEQPAPGKTPADTFLSFAEAATSVQREMLQTYERLSRAWLDRVQAEVEIWKDLAQCLATSKSPTDSIRAYTECMARQIQMSAEDGRHLMRDYQEITQKIAKVVAQDSHAAEEAAPPTAPTAPEQRVTH
jgi:hypothetical protein